MGEADCQRQRVQRYKGTELFFLKREAVGFYRDAVRSKQLLLVYKAKLKQLHASILHNDAVLQRLISKSKGDSEDSKRILTALQAQFRPEVKLRVMVPGAGLCRLAYEVLSRGHSVEVNDTNAPMLDAARFIVRRMLSSSQDQDAQKDTQTQVLRFYPWINHTCNTLSAEHQLKCVEFPDAPPLPRILIPEDFQVKVGEFLEVYYDAEPSQFDCVVTQFFLDTARNPLDYIERIHSLLRPRGIWLDTSPLSYLHPKCLSLTHEQIRTAAELAGFQILSDERLNGLSYAHNPRSMHKYEYSVNWTVYRKK